MKLFSSSSSPPIFFFVFFNLLLFFFFFYCSLLLLFSFFLPPPLPFSSPLSSSSLSLFLLLSLSLSLFLLLSLSLSQEVWRWPVSTWPSRRASCVRRCCCWARPTRTSVWRSKFTPESWVRLLPFLNKWYQLVSELLRPFVLNTICVVVVKSQHCTLCFSSLQ